MELSAALRSASHAPTSPAKLSRSGMRRSRHWRASTESSISAMFSQEPCFGVWWISSLEAARIGGYQIRQTEVEWLFDRMWPSQIRKVASLSAQALSRTSVNKPPADVSEAAWWHHAIDVC